MVYIFTQTLSLSEYMANIHFSVLISWESHVTSFQQWKFVAGLIITSEMKHLKAGTPFPCSLFTPWLVG